MEESWQAADKNISTSFSQWQAENYTKSSVVAHIHGEKRERWTSSHAGLCVRIYGATAASRLLSGMTIWPAGHCNGHTHCPRMSKYGNLLIRSYICDTTSTINVIAIFFFCFTTPRTVIATISVHATVHLILEIIGPLKWCMASTHTHARSPTQYKWYGVHLCVHWPSNGSINSTAASAAAAM